MASKIIVDQLEKTGGALAALTLPVANATANQVLKNDGAGALSWSTPASAGLSTASQWRLTSDFTNAADPITTNLAAAGTPLGFGALGTALTAPLGIFTFPAGGTGYWLINFQWFGHSGGNDTATATIKTTTNNSTWADSATSHVRVGSSTYAGTTSCSYIMKVVDITLDKVSFRVTVTNTGMTTRGDADVNETCMTFIKLGGL